MDLPVDYESLTEAGAMMGSGGMIVMDDKTCMVDVAKYFLNFLRDESCGKCVSCREGTQRMWEIVRDITEGKGKKGDLDLLEELARACKDASMCGLGQTAANPVLSTLRYFRDEYEAHIEDKHVPGRRLHEASSATWSSPRSARAVWPARRPARTDAIRGVAQGRPHHRVQSKCIKCGACLEACRFEAVETQRDEAIVIVEGTA